MRLLTLVACGIGFKGLDVGEHVFHGGRSDLGPSVGQQLPHDGNRGK